MRHTHQLLSEVLRPAQLIGLQVDRPAAAALQAGADRQGARRGWRRCRRRVPEALAPLTPKGGLTRPPAADLLHVKASAFTRKGTPRKGKQTAEIKQELYAKARVIESSSSARSSAASAAGLQTLIDATGVLVMHLETFRLHLLDSIWLWRPSPAGSGRSRSTPTRSRRSSPTSSTGSTGPGGRRRARPRSRPTGRR